MTGNGTAKRLRRELDGDGAVLGKVLRPCEVAGQGRQAIARSAPSFLGCVSALALLVYAAPTRADPCTPGPYAIPFAAGSAEIGSDAKQVIDYAIGVRGACGSSALVLLAGHADTSESPDIAASRVTAVRSYLLSHGFTADQIVAKSLGASAPRIPTPPNAPEPKNRFVDLMYGPANGSE